MASTTTSSGDADHDLRRWLDEWRLRGQVLETERIARLRALDETESARIARRLLWPMAQLGLGDSAEGLLRMKHALRFLAARA